MVDGVGEWGCGEKYQNLTNTPVITHRTENVPARLCTALFRLFDRWPPYIFLFGELLGVEREVIEMEASMPCLAIRHTPLQENAIIIAKNQS